MKDIFFHSFLIFLFFLGPHQGLAYTLNHQSSENIVKWFSTNTNVFINPANSRMDDANATSIIKNSLTNWNASSDFKISSVVNYEGQSNGRNDIYFNSENPFYTGSAVVGVTSLSFNNATGEIVEADIIINDENYNISENANDNYYLGDVITHEIGHFLGLAHSPVHGATMYYKLINGQDGLHSDDISGVRDLYGPQKNVIHGKVMGGNSVEVFGALVQAISTKTGKVVAAGISEQDGRFSIKGLEDDDYHLYTSPLEGLNVLPEHYETRKKNFCAGNSNYRGSYFQSCRGSDEGFPQLIKALNSTSDIDVGVISIRCNLDVPPDYISDKTNFQFDGFIQDVFGQTKIGRTFTGFFTKNEVLASLSDEISIDFSDLDIADLGVSLSDDLYIEVKASNQQMYSLFRNVMQIVRGDGLTMSYPASGLFYDLPTDNEGNTNIDTLIRLPVDMSVANRKAFTVTLTPYRIETIGLVVADAKEKTFPGYDLNTENLYFYSLQAYLVKKLSNGSYVKVNPPYIELDSNLSCLDASSTYKIASNSEQIDATSTGVKAKEKSDFGLAACGSIAFMNNDDDGSGPRTMLFALSLLVMMTYMRFKRLNS